MMNSKAWILLPCLILLATGCGNPPSPAVTPKTAPACSEEFVGPFPSWRNVKSDYGAVGDGKTDDTAALQRALDDLRQHEKHCVLYLPAGTYRITGPLRTERATHHECMGVAIVGEDPATTVLRWDGPTNAVMLRYAAWYSKISRLTFDGAGKAAIGLRYGGPFSTYNETSDLVFQDCTESGLAFGGDSDFGQAENAVLRCTFRRCGTGISTDNFNSLDIWAWECRFEECDYGLYNHAGNFHVWHSLFLRSRKLDIGISNLGMFSFVNNVSVGSRCFLDWQSGHIWGSPTTISGNRIVQYTGDHAIRLGNGGPYLVMDNQIQTPPGQTNAAVVLTWGDQVLVGNTYTVTNAVHEAGRSRRVAERVVPRDRISEELPVLPATPPRRDRRVFEVAAGADSGAIQAAVDEAAKLAGQRPVIHLPMGQYRLAQTIRIPAGCDVQIVGDGGSETATVLNWQGSPGAPVFELASPARASLRDFFLAARAGIGVRVAGCDQPGGVVAGMQLNAMGCNAATNGGLGIVARDIRRSAIQFRNAQGGVAKHWILADNARVDVLCGAASTCFQPYQVLNGADLTVRSVYHEVSHDVPQALRLDGAGTLTLDAAKLAYRTRADTPLVQLDGFRGALTIATTMLVPVDTKPPTRFAVSGNGRDTRLLAIANQFWLNDTGASADTVFENRADPRARAALLACNANSGVKGAATRPDGADGFGFFDNRGDADDRFVLEMLAPLRRPQPDVSALAPAGTTDVRFHRVIISTCTDGIGLELGGHQ